MSEHRKFVGVRPFERHSLVLLVAGLVYVLIGISYAITQPTADRLEALKYALYYVDYNTWGLVFCFVGFLAIISSRWPPFSETWGYTALTGQSAAWALFYLTGVVFGEAASSNLTAVLSWGLTAFLWWAISGLMNPNTVVMTVERIESLHDENLALHAELLRSKEERV